MELNGSGEQEVKGEAEGWVGWGKMEWHGENGTAAYFSID